MTLSNTPVVSILLSHPDFIVVNKPVGVAMHDSETTLLRLLQQQQGLSELHLCHRLDTPTSGVMLLARHPHAAATLGELFAARRIQKYYLALTSKKPKKKQGSIIGNMQKRRAGQWMLCPSTTHPAVTQFFSYGLEEGVRVVLVKPLTGKTHQIRVAMKSLGSPILGDTLYGGAQSDRCYLHAWGLTFDYNGETFSCFSTPQQGEWFQRAVFTRWLEQAPDVARLPWPKVPS